ncbi:MAG: pantoate--beta-alanine ligase [Bdellovibrionaceae bacterium]|nr:pantoate--beta-alanine ligase [Bdellovibrio sp.]
MNKLLTFTSISKFMQYRNSLGGSVGLIPTMGALHAGHASLISRSSAENNFTVVTIYVNPTQFNNADDLKKYPKTWEADLQLAEQSGANAVLAPMYAEIYPDDYKFKLTENDFSKMLCGAHRPGHFDGVLTVVMKLLQISKADKAYFGEKDYQQLQLIISMAKAFFVSTEIVSCPTYREADGLAMSSRNVRLSSAGRKKAPLIFKTLSAAGTPEQARAVLEKEKIKVEYLEDHFDRRFVAAFIDDVRLIDNVKI